MKKNIKELLPFIIAVIVVVLVKLFIFSPVRVTGPSMQPTLHYKDIMILDKISYRFTDIERFDIVVVRHQNEFLIKRVIGLPGEEVEYIDNTLYINGKEVKEQFKHAATDDFNLKRAMGKQVVPKNNYFVLGDNRIDSLDSRAIGFISRDQIQGKANFTILPLSRWGRKE